jgi:hypothetical protein
MRRLRGAFGIAGLSLVLIATCGCPGQQGLSVYPAAINFGTDINSDSFTISSPNGVAVPWTIVQAPAWLELSPMSGTTGLGVATVNMEADRSGLEAGQELQDQVVISSPLGRTSLSVALSSGPLLAPQLAVSPETIDFGAVLASAELTITNMGSGLLEWEATSAPTWLSADPEGGELDPSGYTTATLTVDRDAVPGGNAQGTVVIASLTDGATAEIAVSVGAVPAHPDLAVLPASLDFGTSLNSLPLSIQNAGTGDMAWSLALETDDGEDWLSADPQSGILATETATATVAVSRADLAPGAYTGVVTVTETSGGFAAVQVSMTVQDAILAVNPTTLNFKSPTELERRVFAVSNPGAGTVYWHIDATDLPEDLRDYLSIVPMSGSVAGEPQTVLVALDRASIPLSQPAGDYNGSFEVIRTDESGQPWNPAETATVDVNITVFEYPILSILTDAVNGEGTPLVSADAESETEFFRIGNGGTGTLDWSIPQETLDTLPAWLSISPVAGSIRGEDAPQEIMVSYFRDHAPSSGGYTHAVPIASNGGEGLVVIEMSVPPRPAIGVIPTQVALGPYENVSSFGVFNSGDRGTVLEFTITSDKEWLLFSPRTDTSTGTDTAVKDVKAVSIAIDRSRLESSAPVGTLTVTGYGLTEQAVVTVSVETASLTFETASPRLRFPSLVRWVFLMRDARDQVIPMPPEQLEGAFTLYESGQEVLLDETNFFTTSGSRVRTNIALCLDYSGSMLEAAQAVEPGGGMPGEDNLQRIYERLLADDPGSFIDALPAFYRMALVEFHDRSQGTRLARGFTRLDDRQTVKDSLRQLNIQDHGATELLPAAYDAIAYLDGADGRLLSFDDAGVRAAVVITDGRYTTPPGEVGPLINAALDDRVRFFYIGWGEDVNAETLARIASESGGHYYSTWLDEDGNPSVESLQQALAQVAGDLQGHVVFSYVTLNEESDVETRLVGEFQNPFAPAGVAPTVRGYAEENIDCARVAADTRLGQIALNTEGIQTDGTAVVVTRLEYAPRNIRSFRFTMTAPKNIVSGQNHLAPAGTVMPTAPTVAPAVPGLVDGTWSLGVTVDEVTGVALYNGTASDSYWQVTVDLDAPEMLDYGEFGDLVTFGCTGIASPMRVAFHVDNSLYIDPAAPNFTKYFIYPDSIPLAEQPFLAPSFPMPLAATEPIIGGSLPTNPDDALIINVEDGVFTKPLYLVNVGGNYVYSPFTQVRLAWRAEDPVGELIVPQDVSEGALNSTFEEDIIEVEIDRSGCPGPKAGSLAISYSGDLLDYGDWMEPVLAVFYWDVADSLLVLSPLAIVIPSGSDSADVRIENAGESTLVWEADITGLPDWLTLSSTSGENGPGERTSVTVTADRSSMPAGGGSASFLVTTNGGNGEVQVTVEP